MKKDDIVYMYIPLSVRTAEREDGRIVPTIVDFNSKHYEVYGPPVSVRRLEGLEVFGMGYYEYIVMIWKKPCSNDLQRKRLIYNANRKKWFSIKPVSRAQAAEIRKDRSFKYPKEYYRSFVSERKFLVKN